jgi:uncharacterized membrane protein
MKKSLMALALAVELLPAPAMAITYQKNCHCVTHRIQKRVVYRRSKKKSLAIVAGSAATGASIGAMAGGGIGAGIGAVAGGASGFIYDRVTHKKTIYVQQ